jgi:hypothetical protein
MSATRISVLVGIASVLVLVVVLASTSLNQLGSETGLSRYASQADNDITRLGSGLNCTSR